MYTLVYKMRCRLGSAHVWRYSFLVLKVPEEELTLLLLANSDGASAPFDLGAGNVLKSPFAVAFITLFTDIEAPSP